MMQIREARVSLGHPLCPRLEDSCPGSVARHVPVLQALPAETPRVGNGLVATITGDAYLRPFCREQLVYGDSKRDGRTDAHDYLSQTCRKSVGLEVGVLVFFLDDLGGELDDSVLTVASVPVVVGTLC